MGGQAGGQDKTNANHPGAIPPQMKFTEEIPCWMRHPGVCVTRDSEIWDAVMDEISDGLLKVGMTGKIERGMFCAVDCLTGVFVHTSFWVVAHVRKANPRLVIFVQCRFDEGALEIQVVDGMVQYTVSQGLARRILSDHPLLDEVRIDPLRVRSDRSHIMKVEMLGRAGVALVYSREAAAHLDAGAADEHVGAGAEDPMGQLFSDAMASLASQQERLRPPVTKCRRIAKDVQKTVKDDGFALKTKKVDRDEDDEDSSDVSSATDSSANHDNLAIAALERRRKPEPKPGLEYIKCVQRCIEYVCTHFKLWTAFQIK